MTPKPSDTDARDSGAQAEQTPGARPLVRALIESQPLAAIMYDDKGALLCNAAAERLLTVAPGGAARILAHDGTDLWTILAARSDEAAPTFDVRLRLRTDGAQAPEAHLAVVPIRGAKGSLGGAVCFVMSVSSERLAAMESTAGPIETLEQLIGVLGPLVGAAEVYVLEIDADFSRTGRVLAAWTDDGTEVSREPFGLEGTPAGSFAGRRLVCVASGAAETYPGDAVLAGGRYSAYVGVALSSPSGEQSGVLAGLWREPLTDAVGTAAVFSIISAQAAHALSDLVAQRELRESEQRYSSVFEGSAVPILLVEPHTTQVVDANPAACAFYGYPREEFVTMSVLQVDSLAPEAVQAELRRALERSRNNFLGRHMLADGSLRDVEVSIGPIMVGGRPLLYAMMNDVTERMRMEAAIERSKRNLEMIVEQRTQDLLRANAELQQASTARDMVFVSLAHELRTSLQTITGFSDLLAGEMAGGLSEEQRRQVDMIHQAGKRLSAFASTLIEAQRLGERDLVCDMEEFDLVGLAESVLFGLASFAEDKKLALSLEAAERPIGVATDRYKLQQILLNLLSNAIRYTERGGVTVAVSSDGTTATVAVADTGPGISSERLETLFDGPEVHDSGAGIGLPASRRIAAVLGGTIEAASEVREGSVFTLKIPVRCVPGADEASHRDTD